MVRRKIMGLFVCTLILGMASFAFALVPDLATSSATTAYHAGGGVDVVSVLLVPNGSGNPFTVAYEVDGTVVDATVTVYLRDAGGNAIANFPAEDMWLASAGMNACDGGSIADGSTDALGAAVWANSLFGGGVSSTILTQVIISGDALTSSAGMGITFNSPDMNGDGVVNLSDIGAFAADLDAFKNFGTYSYRADFVRDGVLNLADIGRVAPAIGKSCS